VGYRIAGTTPSMTLTVMKERGIDYVTPPPVYHTDRIFLNAARLCLLSVISSTDRSRGWRAGRFSLRMSRTFSYLRSNDLIYQLGMPAATCQHRPRLICCIEW
jgi:polyhydroxyalkanoate synthase